MPRGAAVAALLLASAACCSAQNVQLTLTHSQSAGQEGHLIVSNGDDVSYYRVYGPTFGQWANWMESQMSAVDSILSTVFGVGGGERGFDGGFFRPSFDAGFFRSSYLHQTSGDAYYDDAESDDYTSPGAGSGALGTQLQQELAELAKAGRRGWYTFATGSPAHPCPRHAAALTAGSVGAQQPGPATGSREELYYDESSMRQLEELEAADVAARLEAAAGGDARVVYASSANHFGEGLVDVARGSAAYDVSPLAWPWDAEAPAQDGAGRGRWGLFVFGALSAACLLVWAALLSACCSLREAVASARQRGQFIAGDDASAALLEPLAANDYQEPCVAAHYANPLTQAARR